MFRSKIKTKFGLFCIFLGLAVGASAQAQTRKQPVARKTAPVYKSVDREESSSGELWKGSPRKTDNEAFFGLGLNYFNSFGFQGRYAYRILPEGFVDGVNDSFFIEGGLGLTLYSGATGVNFQAAGRWDFMMDHDWTFFGTVGLGYNAVGDDDKKGKGVYPVVGVGALYTIDADWAARGDFSYNFFGVGAAYRF